MEFIKIENLPLETNRQIYKEFCEKAIYEDSYALNFVNFNNLPKENNKEIYALLCKNAVEDFIIALKWIKIENLPEKFQNLNDNDLKNAILNYIPSTGELLTP